MEGGTWNSLQLDGVEEILSSMKRETRSCQPRKVSRAGLHVDVKLNSYYRHYDHHHIGLILGKRRQKYQQAKQNNKHLLAQFGYFQRETINNMAKTHDDSISWINCCSRSVHECRQIFLLLTLKHLFNFNQSCIVIPVIELQ